MAFERSVYEELLAAVSEAEDANEKGSALEDLCEYLFGCLEGVAVEERDLQLAAEELDLALWNAGLEEVLRRWDDVILLEAKNWSEPVGAPALDPFLAKLRRRGLRNGILVAANGVTGTFRQGAEGHAGAVQILTAALQEGLRVIVLTLEDLEAIEELGQLRALIRRKYCSLLLGKVA